MCFPQFATYPALTVESRGCFFPPILGDLVNRLSVVSWILLGGKVKFMFCRKNSLKRKKKGSYIHVSMLNTMSDFNCIDTCLTIRC